MFIAANNLLLLIIIRRSAIGRRLFKLIEMIFLEILPSVNLAGFHSDSHIRICSCVSVNYLSIDLS